MRLIRSFLESEDAATAIEYCLIAGVISIAIVVGMTSIGTKINQKFFTPISNGLN